jgi:hypothetical protein
MRDNSPVNGLNGYCPNFAEVIARSLAINESIIRGFHNANFEVSHRDGVLVVALRRRAGAGRCDQAGEPVGLAGREGAYGCLPGLGQTGSQGPGRRGTTHQDTQGR